MSWEFLTGERNDEWSRQNQRSFEWVAKIHVGDIVQEMSIKEGWTYLMVGNLIVQLTCEGRYQPFFLGQIVYVVPPNSQPPSMYGYRPKGVKAHIIGFTPLPVTGTRVIRVMPEPYIGMRLEYVIWPLDPSDVATYADMVC